jgi:hypothetical protein
MKHSFLLPALSLIALTCFFPSCAPPPGPEKIGNTDSVTTQKPENTNDPLLSKFQLLELPHTDSTGYDKHENVVELSDEEAIKLKLASTIGTKDIQYIKKFNAHYRINFSDDFYSLVFCYQYSENEYFSVLVNYAKNFELIDFKEITYDEVAEGLLRNTAVLSEGKIKLINTQFSEEGPVTIFEEYIVGNDGQITLKK